MELATTEDHQPARVFFRGKQWPEGFVYPACEPCNAASRESEKLMSLLIHGEADNEDRTSFQKTLASISREHRNLIRGMLPKSANEVRSILRAKGLSRRPGETLSEIPIVKLDVSFWSQHFDMFSRKLLLAWHYSAFQKPLSRTGMIWAYHHSNADEPPHLALDLASRLIKPSRQRQMLDDQFAIRWDVVPDYETALFVAHFHNKFGVTGITTEMPHDFLSEKRVGQKPFQW